MVEDIVRKEKLLITSNFSFSHYVFHSYMSLVRQNEVLFGNGLTPSHTMTPFDAPGKQAF